VGLVIVGVAAAVMETPPSSPIALPALTTSGWVTVVAAAFFWTGISGAGGVGFQPWDWIKHNSILKDLMSLSWPVVYSAGTATEKTLCFNLAYYLPSAAIGKAAGWTAANVALSAWSFFGLVLAFAGFAKLVGQKFSAAVLLFPFLCGVKALLQRTLDWPDLLSYPPGIGQFMWAPHHVLPAWIATALMVSTVFSRRSLAGIGFIAMSTLLWSPLVTVGLLPILVASAVECRGQNGLSLRNGLSLVPAFFVAAFYASHSFDIASRWYWNVHRLSDVWPYLVVSYFFEFGFVAVYCANRRLHDQDTRHVWLSSAVVFLIVLPWYLFGYYNDLTMRGALPAFFILWAIVLRNFFSVGRWGFSHYVLFIFLLVGAYHPFLALQNGLRHFRVRIPYYKKVYPMEKFPYKHVYGQYFGQTDTFFYRHLARRH
jgi:hypothetical protein